MQQANGVKERMTRRMMVAMVMTLMMIGMSIREAVKSVLADFAR